jgi:hypothetical protein
MNGPGRHVTFDNCAPLPACRHSWQRNTTVQELK